MFIERERGRERKRELLHNFYTMAMVPSILLVTHDIGMVVQSSWLSVSGGHIKSTRDNNVSISIIAFEYVSGIVFAAAIW